MELKLIDKLRIPSTLITSYTGIWVLSGMMYQDFYAVRVYDHSIQRTLWNSRSFMTLRSAKRVCQAWMDKGYQAWIDPCFYTYKKEGSR